MWPVSAALDPFLVDAGPESLDFGRTCSEFGPGWPNFDRTWPVSVGPSSARFAKLGAFPTWSLAPIWANVGLSSENLRRHSLRHPY